MTETLLAELWGSMALLSRPGSGTFCGPVSACRAPLFNLEEAFCVQLKGAELIPLGSLSDPPIFAAPLWPTFLFLQGLALGFAIRKNRVCIIWELC